MSRRDGAAGTSGTRGVWSPALVRLDRDLREIVIEERTSFEAELRAELAAEYNNLLSEKPSRFSRARPARLAAAAVVLLLTGASLVPAARASLVRLLFPAPESGPVTDAQLNPVDFAGNPVVPGVVREESVLPETETREDVPAPLPEPVATGEEDGQLPPPPTLPALQDATRARLTVAEEYPVALQEAGLGGVVRVLVWVRPDGAPETPTVRSSSGLAGLDQAALRATGSLQFVPATRSGLPVGTWVEFAIRFLPNAMGSHSDPEYEAFEIPTIN